MRPFTKQFFGGAFVLIGLYLVLIHNTGFTRDLGALGSANVNIFKALQGR